MIPEPSFTVGVEEEYMIVDKRTRDLIHEAPPGLMEECSRLFGDNVSPEFLQCQIEVGTPVCRTMSEVREHLASLRGGVAGVLERRGFGLMAASTHPFAKVGHVLHTPKERYNALAQDLQQVVRRLAISGMHVHVGIEDDDLRVDLMSQASYVLPHLLALSTSSPFWAGRDTGLKSYRIAVWDELPRTGLPESFDSFSEYRRHVDVLIRAGIIEDATKVWWDIRPSHRFPTLEMRIPDVCTRLDDAVCVAALYRCWLRMLYRLRRDNMKWRRYARMMIDENRWRAQRYGIDEGLLDFGRGEIVAYPDLFAEMQALLEDDVEYFDCDKQVRRGERILSEGTSAHRQIACYERSLADGADQDEALRAVVDMLIADTLLADAPSGT